MGYAKSQGIAKREKASGKGIGKYAGGAKRTGNGTPIGWDEVDAVAIAALVAAVTNAGDAVILGRTSDGGALSLTILSGDDKHREYWSDPEAALTGLRELAILAAM